MTDDNAPVRKAHKRAREHLSAVKARREAMQALIAQATAPAPQEAAQSSPPPPVTEAA